MTSDIVRDASAATSPAEVKSRILAATSLSYVIVILDTSIVNVGLEPIARAFDSNIAGLQWVVTAYVLMFATLLLSGGSLGDRLGSRKIYLLGLLVFACASACCGLAPHLIVLIGARVMQGVGAAMLVPCSLSLINAAFSDPAERARALGVWSGLGAIAVAAGPLVGGVLIQFLGWRSIFMVNVPIAALGAWLTTRVPPEVAPPKPRAMDVIGQAAAIVAIGATAAALLGGVDFALHSNWGRAFDAAAILAWIVFLSAEARSAEPMLPLSFFRDPVFTGTILISLASAIVFYGLFFLLSLYFQQMRGLSPLQTGLSFLPLTAMVAVGSFISSTLGKRAGALGAIVLSFFLYGLGCVGLLALADSEPSYWRIAFFFPMIGLAAGIVTPTANATLMGLVEKSRAGIAAGVLNVSRQLGAACGVGIFAALLTMFEPHAAAIRIAMYVGLGVSVAAGLIWTAALASARPRT